MANPKEYHFDLPPVGKPALGPIPEMWFPGVEHYWRYSTSRRIVDPVNGIAAVVIHATAGHASTHAVDGMHPPAQKKVSFHWLIPDENEAQHGSTVWACVRERDAAWHVRDTARHSDVNGGERNVNHWSLGIEVVNLQRGPDPFSDWQVAVTATIVRYCWAKYPNLRHVVSHAKMDPTRRNDPGENFPWERFKAMVLTVDQNPLDEISIDSTRARAGRVEENASYEEEVANSRMEDPKADEFHEVTD